ncbi:unnamed protein product [Linum trigynum]|uniref:F-box associated beta-propeller type 1 domain-containing protein n=1 Tax=Linum trigynum TaxID=586398 RepID=A0AAV2CSM3_9ROSI
MALQRWCGVGLDLVSHDIKVVLFHNYFLSANPMSISSSPVYLYSLHINCWKDLPESYLHHELIRHWLYNPAYFKGFFYWIFRSRKNEYVVAFDMGNDSFQKINYPCDAPDRKCNATLACIAIQSLCLRSR